MDIKELTEVMVKYSLVIRAIPNEVKSIVETRHIKQYPSGKIEYLAEFKRDMLVVRSKPENAGKIIIVSCSNTSAKVDFTRPKKYFDSVEKAVKAVIETEKSGEAW